MDTAFGRISSTFLSYFHWKVLFGFGTAFWLLLCLTDDFYERKIYEHPLLQLPDQFFEEELENLPMAVPSEKPPKPPEMLIEEVEDNAAYDVLKVLFWNIVAFLSTLCACFTIKYITTRMVFANAMSTIGSRYLQNASGYQLAIRRCSSSRIPIPVVSKTSSIDIHIDTSDVGEEYSHDSESGNKSCPNFFGVPPLELEPEPEKEHDKTKKIWSIRMMEKHCSKLREEMINLQATSLKEHASISKKLDSLTAEKKELGRQLSIVLKENKALKLQMGEVIDERALLFKKLEAASKEIRTIAKSKKSMAAKLEETITNAETFKANLDQIARDKVILEDKLMVLDAEYKRVQEELSLYKHKDSSAKVQLSRKGSEESRNPNKEHAIDIYELSDDQRTIITKDAGDMDEGKAARLSSISGSKLGALAQLVEEADFDISRSEKDMKKVQQKLITLERSLESFKIRDATKMFGASQEKCDLYPVNELDISVSPRTPQPASPFYSARSHSQPSSHSRLHNFYTGGRDDALASSPSSSANDSSPLPNRSSASLSSTLSVCSDADCPLEHSDCSNPRCTLLKRCDNDDVARHRHHHHHRYDHVAATRKRSAEDAVVSTQIDCVDEEPDLERPEGESAERFLVTTNASNSGAETETALSSDTSLYHVLAREQIKMMCQRPLRFLRTTVSDDRLSAISEKVSDSDEFEPKRKIFTNTPEFQNLLKEILDTRHSSDEVVRETDDSDVIF